MDNAGIRDKDILRVDTQRDTKTGKDFATVTFRSGGKVRYAWVKNLQDKPADMELTKWCLIVLNTHYLVRQKEQQRGKKIITGR